MFQHIELSEQTFTPTQAEQFLALDCSEVEEIHFGVVKAFRGFARRSVGPIEKGDIINLTLKENAKYQEWKYNEDAPY